MQLTEQLEDFRGQVRAWIHGELASAPPREGGAREHRETRARWWQGRLAAGGYAGLTWPERLGGRGLSPLHEFVFNDEADAQGAPVPSNFLAMIMVGPAIMEFGTEAQRTRYLPGILSGEETWCIGFSEPEAGSDLAGLRTSAQPADGGWLVNGQKTWTSWAHVAQRCALLVRTDRSARHAGLSCMLASMDAAQVRPIEMINGDADFNEVWWDDAFVPAGDVLHDLGGGWEVALHMLLSERRSIPVKLQAEAHRFLEQLAALIDETGLASEPSILEELGALAARVRSLRAGSLAEVRAIADGLPMTEASLTLKLRWSRTMQALTTFARSVCEEAGLDPDDARLRSWDARYLRARGNSIESGTDEVVLSLIAERTLALPRAR